MRNLLLLAAPPLATALYVYFAATLRNDAQLSWPTLLLIDWGAIIVGAIAGLPGQLLIFERRFPKHAFLLGGMTTLLSVFSAWSISQLAFGRPMLGG